jgi:16S rRNA (cytidine1402-2'-O)-methyltransferase
MTLYVVATPIGHLDDITLRAIEILKSVGFIACEDTRETRKLLDHIGIVDAELLSYHAQSADSREDQILERLLAGGTAAIVSDRGTPGISDPGSRLIRRAVEAGISVVPIPGASAVITALQASGADTSRFEYLGFLPHKKGRQTLFEYMKSVDHTVVFYESPHRILKTLDALRDSGKQIVVCRELTKMHEEFVRGSAEAVYEAFAGRSDIRGEFVVIVS